MQKKQLLHHRTAFPIAKQRMKKEKAELFMWKKFHLRSHYKSATLLSQTVHARQKLSTSSSTALMQLLWFNQRIGHNLLNGIQRSKPPARHILSQRPSTQGILRHLHPSSISSSLLQTAPQRPSQSLRAALTFLAAAGMTFHASISAQHSHTRINRQPLSPSRQETHTHMKPKESQLIIHLLYLEPPGRRKMFNRLEQILQSSP